jgi:alpha-galactosidase
VSDGCAVAIRLAATPPMGWSSWNAFGCAVTEQVVRAQADALVATGMRDLGYQYVNVDDCWMAPERGADGSLQADPLRFPSGIPALAEYVHGLGLKLGVYSSPGATTCMGSATPDGGTIPNPGSFGHEGQDAWTFAAWKVDYLKYDRCSAPESHAEERFAAMQAALEVTGRPIVYSINPSGAPHAKAWSAYANLWRTTDDVAPLWQDVACPSGGPGRGVVTGCRSDPGLGVADILDKNGPLCAAAGPGHWNDPDMLEVGVTKLGLPPLALSDVEAQTQVSMWAVMAAPLIAGNDLTAMSAASASTLTNAEIIEVDQDPLGSQGRRVAQDGDQEVWVKALRDGSAAVALLNRGSAPAVVRATWTDAGLSARPARVRDLWAHADVGTSGGGYSAQVQAHGAIVLRVWKNG